MLKKSFFLSLIVIFLLSLETFGFCLAARSQKGKVWAAKIRVRRGGTSTTGTSYSKGRVTSSVKFRGDRRAIIVNFAGLTNAISVSYSLTYNSNGIPQGAMGTISNITTSTDTRELLFGTCSGGVCRYHTGITNAKLVITSKLKSGYTTRKTYRLKI